MNSGESRLLFEIEGKPRRTLSLKKHRSYIALYNDHVHVILKGEEYRIPKNDIFDVYIQEPLAKSPTTIICFFENDEECVLNLLDDETFPELSEKMERLLQDEWACFMEKRKYPDTIRWFIACCSLVAISSNVNPYIYGLSSETPKTAAAQREELTRSWGFRNRDDLLDMLPSLINGRAIKEYWKDSKDFPNLKKKKQRLIERVENTCGDNGIWAWDLQRYILLCQLGYNSEYLSYEESLDLALVAAKKLQSIFKSWDEFMDSYILGYCYWSEDDIEDEFSEAYARSKAYEFYKNREVSPWNIDWNCPLKCEWTPSGMAGFAGDNIVKCETPSGEVHSADYSETVRDLCVSAQFDPDFIVTGNSLKYNAQFLKAKKNLAIPDEETAFLLNDSTLADNFKKGLVICSTGVYYRASPKSETVYVEWEKFKDVDVKFNPPFDIVLDGVEIWAHDDVSEKLYKLLLKIQDCYK